MFVGWLFSLTILLPYVVGFRPCSFTGCSNGGTCVDFSHRSFKDPKAHCVCRPGFTGSMCETLITNCDQKPCRNGGTCFDVDPSSQTDNNTRGFTCSCLSEQIGEFCENNRNYCVDAHYCENGGTCLYVNGLTTCVCPFAYAGDKCERRLDKCSIPDACLNGGECRDDFCLCLNGFSGDRCERVVPLFEEYEKLGCGESAEFCAWRFANGICNEECNDRKCFFDGFDCVANTSQCRHREYCAINYANGNCDKECSSVECGGDGGDCDFEGEHPREWPARALALLFHAAPHIVIPKLRILSATLAQTIHSQVQIAYDREGRSRIFYWRLSNGTGNRVLLDAYYRGDEYPFEKADGVLIFFDIDVSDCESRLDSVSTSTLMPMPCFADASGAAAYIISKLDTRVGEGWRIAGLPVKQVYAEKKAEPPSPPVEWLQIIVLGVCGGLCAILLVLAIYGFVKIAKRQKKDSETLSAPVWKIPRIAELSDVPKNRSRTNSLASRGNYGPQSSHSACMTDRGSIASYSSSFLNSSAPLKRSRNAAPQRRTPLPLPTHVEVTSTELEKMISVEVHNTSCISADEPPPSTSQSQCLVSQNPDEVTEDQLLAAIRVGSKEMVDLVLLQGADVNVADADGNTALHHAVAVNSVDILHTLLRTSQCNLRAVNVLGQTALTFAARLPDVSDDCVLILIEFMNEAFWKAYKDPQNSSSTKRGNGAIVTYLQLPTQKVPLKLSGEMMCEANDETVVDFSGRSALHYAALNNRLGIISLLYGCGVPLNRKDNEGDTALHLAVREGHFHMVKYLLDLGADRSIKNELGHSPLDVATEKGWQQVEALLKVEDGVTLRPPSIVTFIGT